jgi:hypothetical protein
VTRIEARPIPQGADASFEWGSDLGEPIALLRAEPEQLAKTAGVSFSAGHDDLDYVKVAIVTVPSGAAYALVRHERSPEQGTQIVARSPQPSAALGTDLDSLLKRLGVSPSAVTWVRPDVARTRRGRRPFTRLAETLRSLLYPKSSR